MYCQGTLGKLGLILGLLYLVMSCVFNGEQLDHVSCHIFSGIV